MNTLKKHIRKLYMKFKESTFKRNGKSLKYLLIKQKSDCLIVSFSGFASDKDNAAYNYIRTLKDINVNKLFLLDDFGFEKRGSYYLGEDGDFFIEEMVTNIIEKIIKERGIRKVICIGSSKGGTAAIYFGLKLGADMIIAGAPQYYIGDYLNKNKEHRKILTSIMGNSEEESILFLNKLIPNIINDYSYTNKPKIYIHYSTNEHTYSEHIIDLLEGLNNNNFEVLEDARKYQSHFEVAVFFPAYLKKVLKNYR